jgi:hypothetical protein
MEVIDPLDRLRVGLNVRQVQIDDNRLLTAAHDDARERLVVASVDFLMGDVGRHVDEIAGAGLGDEFEPLAPTHPRPPADHINDALHRPVMVRARLRHRVDDDRSGPKLLRPGAGVRDRRGAAHAGRLGRVDVEFVRMDHPDAVKAPSSLVAIVHGGSPVCANLSPKRAVEQRRLETSGRLAIAHAAS